MPPELAAYYAIASTLTSPLEAFLAGVQWARDNAAKEGE